MSPRRRLVLALARILAPTAVVGCGVAETDDSATAPPVLDDVACLDVALGDPCPGPDVAEGMLVGDETCEDPVREVVASGDFLFSNEVIYSGYGGYDLYEPGDTGFSDPKNRCCYEAAYVTHPGEGCVIGRPLRVDGRMVSARATTREGWAGSLCPDLAGLDPAQRATLAAAWERDGLLEHASIAAFARLSLELLALGAPAELLARTAAAMADEVVHAEGCFALASAYAGRPVGPGPLPVPSRRRASLTRLATETYVEGCVGETLAVGRAAAQLATATDPAVRALLARIVADESRHAELAWDIVRWALEVGGTRVRTAVSRVVTAARVEEPGFEALTVPQHGLPEAAHIGEAIHRLMAEVVAPSAADLLAA